MKIIPQYNNCNVMLQYNCLCLINIQIKKPTWNRFWLENKFSWRKVFIMNLLFAILIQGFLIPPSNLLKCNENEYKINELICVIKCPISCGGGVCLSDGTCLCYEGYFHLTGTKYICVSKCNDICETLLFGSAAK